ncbi:MAG: hypothetical protein HQK54_06695 [Oligoflexales bacterium]|nr:hypothetical protein [Oligoflexales bacterium]
MINVWSAVLFIFLTVSLSAFAGAPPIVQSSGAASPSSSQSPAVNAKSDPQPVTISNGTRIFLKEKGMSIIPPAGWEVHYNEGGQTLLFQVPYSENQYQRTIKVLYAREPLTIDSYTMDKFAEIILDKGSKRSSGIIGYQLLNKEIITMANGSKGLLYYTSFALGSTPMMELHIVVSSADGHFLMTYTDVDANFKSEDGKKFLDVAYESMTSIELSTPPPSRFQFLVRLGVILVVIVVFLIAGSIIRGSRASKLQIDEEGAGGGKAAKAVDSPPITDNGNTYAYSGTPTSLSDGNWSSGHGSLEDTVDLEDADENKKGRPVAKVGKEEQMPVSDVPLSASEESLEWNLEDDSNKTRKAV